MCEATVQIRAIEIGFWRVSSSFLKLEVKSGQVASSFLKFRKLTPKKNFRSPPHGGGETVDYSVTHERTAHRVGVGFLEGLVLLAV